MIQLACINAWCHTLNSTSPYSRWEEAGSLANSFVPDVYDIASNLILSKVNWKDICISKLDCTLYKELGKPHIHLHSQKYRCNQAGANPKLKLIGDLEFNIFAKSIPFFSFWKITIVLLILKKKTK